MLFINLLIIITEKKDFIVFNPNKGTYSKGNEEDFKKKNKKWIYRSKLIYKTKFILNYILNYLRNNTLLMIIIYQRIQHKNNSYIEINNR